MTSVTTNGPNEDLGLWDDVTSNGWMITSHLRTTSPPSGNSLGTPAVSGN